MLFSIRVLVSYVSYCFKLPVFVWFYYSQWADRHPAVPLFGFFKICLKRGLEIESSSDKKNSSKILLVNKDAALPSEKVCISLRNTQLKKKKNKEILSLGTSLVVQWLGLSFLMQGGVGLIPGQGAKTPHASWPKSKEHKKNIVTNSIRTLKIVHIYIFLIFKERKKYPAYSSKISPQDTFNSPVTILLVCLILAVFQVLF